jgi:hypothetical protein
MLTKEEAQFQFFKQTGFGAYSAPSGILIPGETGWNVKKSRNKLENAQVQGDGFKREFANGNHVSTAGGQVIYNLNWLGHELSALCDGLTSAAFTGVYSVTVTNGGSGYTSAPTVGFTGGDGTGLTAVAVVMGGSVVAVVITNPGTGYTTAPTAVTFTGGAGTGAAATAALSAGKYKHTGNLSAGTPTYYGIEKYAPASGGTPYRLYLNQVLRKLSFSDQVEGICSATDDWVGSGAMTKNAASADATPTEVTGTPGEYANLFILEGGAVSGVLSELSMDIECQVKEKRTPNGTGQASELRRGGWTVTGSGRAWFENEDLAAKTEAGTLTTLLLVITSPDGIFNRSLAEVKFEFADWERTDDGIVIPVSFESIKKASALSPFETTLINGTASY